jgi:hypothetical protein
MTVRPELPLTLELERDRPGPDVVAAAAVAPEAFTDVASVALLRRCRKKLASSRPLAADMDGLTEVAVPWPCGSKVYLCQLPNSS